MQGYAQVYPQLVTFCGKLSSSRAICVCEVIHSPCEKHCTHVDNWLWIKVIHSPESLDPCGFVGFELYTCGQLYPPVDNFSLVVSLACELFRKRDAFPLKCGFT